MYKETMCPCRHPHLRCMFHLPFVHTLLLCCLRVSVLFR